MAGRLAIAVLAIAWAFACADQQASAQELEVRQWNYLPNNTNFATASYVGTHADIDSDPALLISDVKFEMKTFMAAYMRSFSVLGHSARLDLRLPWKQASWSGVIGGAPASAEREGFGDSSVRFSMHLVGAPPLEGDAYAAYRAAHPRETLLGVALAIELPTGEYQDDKLLNIGANRYTFRPQIGLQQSFGPWSFESTAMVAIFTDNNDFFRGATLEQEPIYSLQGHATYTFPERLWLSAGAAGSMGGEVTVNGLGKNNPKDALFFGFSVGFPVMQDLGLKLGYVGIRGQTSTAPDSDSFVASLSTFW